MFAVLTIFLFLFSVRSTLVAAISIPLSILTALVVMQLTGISLNIMTLGGLAVAVGRVVDDAIVVLENIYRHRALGEDRLTASLKGPREVAGAITASTLTTVAVFLPLGFVGGLVSQFFLPFALTVTFALLASLICALTVVPVLAYLFIDKVKVNVDEDGEPKRSFWVRAYTPVITCVLQHRAGRRWASSPWPASCSSPRSRSCPLLPTQFINAGGGEDRPGQHRPADRAPRPRRSSNVAIEAETIIIADPDVELVQTSIPGEGDTSFQTIIAAQSGRPANSATITVRLTAGRRPGGQDGRVLATALEPIKTDGYDVQVSQAAGFTSQRPERHRQQRRPRRGRRRRRRPSSTALEGNPDLANLPERPGQGHPRDPGHRRPVQGVRRRPDRGPGRQRGPHRARLARPSPRSPSRTGSRSTSSSRSTPTRRPRVEELAQLPVGTVTKVPLEQVATVEQADVQGSITRIDQSPAASITAEITSEDTGAVSQPVQADHRRAGRRRDHPGRRDGRAGRRLASSSPRPSAACSPRWAWPSCWST